jgi:hypothetical protein
VVQNTISPKQPSFNISNQKKAFSNVKILRTFSAKNGKNLQLTKNRTEINEGWSANHVVFYADFKQVSFVSGVS